MSNKMFGIVAEVIDANHYSIITNWGQRVEATYYRTDVMATFAAGHHVFIERVEKSNLWMITSHAFGAPSADMGWFEVDNDTWGLVDGPGRVMP